MTNIEWTDVTWNPVTGCDRVSPGCAHCYALTRAGQLKRNPKMQAAGLYQVDGDPRTSGPGFGVTLRPEVLDKPLHWREPRKVFVNSMSDLFHEQVPDEFIDRVFAVMGLTPWHTYQVLTKRPTRMLAYLTAGESYSRSHNILPIGPKAPGPQSRWCDAADTLIEAGAVRYSRYPEDGEHPCETWPLDNVWLGVSAENQHWADERIPLLLQTPSAVRFVSLEPLLRPVDLTRLTLPPREGHPGSFPQNIDALEGLHVNEMGFEFKMAKHHALHWVIVGGESGPKRRPFDPQWARDVRDQCAAAGVAFFMKQLGGARPGTKLDDLPEDLRIREFPR